MPPSKDSPGPPERRRRERRYRATLALGLLLSVVVHAALLLLTGGVDVPSASYRTPPTEPAPAPDALIVLDVPESPEEEAPETPRPEPREEPTPRPEVVEPTPVEPAPERAAPPPAEPEPAAPTPEAGEELTAAERLRPRFGDARLWVDPRDPRLVGERLRRFARADSAVRAILRDWLDSLALTEEQRRRALDWTYEKDGKRWGISPEGLHLGDLTIPIPLQLLPTGPKRREFEQALRDLREIQWQDLRADLERVEDERREEMRRRSREEAERRRGSDTTSIGARGRSPPSPEIGDARPAPRRPERDVRLVSFPRRAR